MNLKIDQSPPLIPLNNKKTPSDYLSEGVFQL